MSPTPSVVRTRESLESAKRTLRSGGRSVGLVPTMGALHPGHLSLIDHAAELCDATAISIFVNPLQFGPDEDFARYPRDPDRDLKLAGRHGVELAFLPTESVMYPDGSPRVSIDPGIMAEGLCGASRPGHFSGVLTVVAKLLGLVQPDVAVFGRKDFQQAALIQRMVRDLDLPVRIEIAPLVREEDGLAMSSRNAYLSREEREDALGLFRALSAVDEQFHDGARDRARLLRRAREVIAEHSGLRLEYAEIVEPDTLDPSETPGVGSVVAVAGICGRTRLIDNLVLGSPEPDPRIPSSDPDSDPDSNPDSDPHPRIPSGEANRK